MRLSQAALLLLVLTAGSGCAKLHGSSRARPPVDTPPLETPSPPPRVIVVPIESEPIVSTAAPIVEEPDRLIVREPARNGTSAGSAPTSKPEKPEAPSAAAPTPASTAPAPPAPTDTTVTPPTLQTTANGAEMERKVRGLLANAARDLGRVDYRNLTVDAKAQYDIAKRFSEQAEEALKVKNVVFAGQLADKAATLAALLVRR